MDLIKELLQKPFLPGCGCMMGRVELVYVCVYLSVASHLFQSTSALHSCALTQRAAASQTKEDEHEVIMTAEIQLITFFIF